MASSAPGSRAAQRSGARRRCALETAGVVALVAAAAWLRLVHLGTASLWWDELVHIRTADRPLSAVLHEVKWGIPPGAGNAGAMPADYVLLHLYLRLAGAPTPERIEAHFRAPACAYSILAVLAQYLVARALFGRAAAALAALLLATSLPAILYAAEARSYSLLTLVAILQLAAFAAVARAPRRIATWATYAGASALYFLTGILGLLVIGTQYVVLAVRGVAAGGRRELGFLAATALAVAALALAYFSGIAVGSKHSRGALVAPAAVTWEALAFLAGGSNALRAAFVAALPLCLWAGVRRGRVAVAAALVLGFGALPVVALLIRWKQYYFHGRHVLFLLPAFDLVLAVGLTEALRRLDPLSPLLRSAAARRAAEASLLAALVVLTVAPTLRTYVAAPKGFFARTKTLRDTREVAARLAREARETSGAERDTPYLLVAERESTANALLTAYLAWYDLDGRVTLRSPGVPLGQVEAKLLADGGDPTCLGLRPAVGLTPGLRRLLGLDTPFGTVPRRVQRFGLVGYADPLEGADVRRFFGITFREPPTVGPLR